MHVIDWPLFFPLVRNHLYNMSIKFAFEWFLKELGWSWYFPCLEGFIDSFGQHFNGLIFLPYHLLLNNFEWCMYLLSIRFNLPYSNMDLKRFKYFSLAFQKCHFHIFGLAPLVLFRMLECSVSSIFHIAYNLSHLKFSNPHTHKDYFLILLFFSQFLVY